MSPPQEQTLSSPEQWLDLHGDALFRFALLRVRDTHLAEELVQETFCAALQAREKYSGRSSERTWLIGILKHKIIDSFRRMSRERPHDDPDLHEAVEEEFFDSKGRWRVQPGDWNASPDEALERREFWEVIHSCMARLPDRLRQVFALREVDGTDSSEICKVLGISSTNLWVMMHRARAQLRQCLETHWFEAGGGH